MPVRRQRLDRNFPARFLFGAEVELDGGPTEVVNPADDFAGDATPAARIGHSVPGESNDQVAGPPARQAEPDRTVADTSPPVAAKAGQYERQQSSARTGLRTRSGRPGGAGGSNRSRPNRNCAGPRRPPPMRRCLLRQMYRHSRLRPSRLRRRPRRPRSWRRPRRQSRRQLHRNKARCALRR